MAPRPRTKVTRTPNPETLTFLTLNLTLTLTLTLTLPHPYPNPNPNSMTEPGRAKQGLCTRFCPASVGPRRRRPSHTYFARINQPSSVRPTCAQTARGCTRTCNCLVQRSDGFWAGAHFLAGVCRLSTEIPLAPSAAAPTDGSFQSSFRADTDVQKSARRTAQFAADRSLQKRKPEIYKSHTNRKLTGQHDQISRITISTRPT